jgi:hypothetical protein
MFLQYDFNLVDALRVLLLKDLVSDGGRQHMAGDVPGRNVKGHGKREKHKGHAVTDTQQGRLPNRFATR